jgi:hypothetical protein
MVLVTLFLSVSPPKLLRATRYAPLAGDLQLARSARPNAQPIYMIAPIIDEEFPNAIAQHQQTEELEDAVKTVFRQSVDRIKPTNDDAIQSCPSYPCEVVTEVVSFDENKIRYHFQFRIRVIRAPGDASPDPPNHPRETDAVPCTRTVDYTLDNCYEKARRHLSHSLQAHDDAFHKREQ